jgi:hypothetical protein
MEILERIISYVKEAMVANPPGQSGAFSASSKPEGPTAGNTYRLPLTLRRWNKKRYIYQKNTRKNWTSTPKKDV